MTTVRCATIISTCIRVTAVTAVAGRILLACVGLVEPVLAQTETTAKYRREPSIGRSIFFDGACQRLTDADIDYPSGCEALYGSLLPWNGFDVLGLSQSGGAIGAQYEVKADPELGELVLGPARLAILPVAPDVCQLFSPNQCLSQREQWLLTAANGSNIVWGSNVIYSAGTGASRRIDFNTIAISTVGAAGTMTIVGSPDIGAKVQQYRHFALNQNLETVADDSAVFDSLVRSNGFRPLLVNELGDVVGVQTRTEGLQIAIVNMHQPDRFGDPFSYASLTSVRNAEPVAVNARREILASTNFGKSFSVLRYQLTGDVVEQPLPAGIQFVDIADDGKVLGVGYGPSVAYIYTPSSNLLARVVDLNGVDVSAPMCRPASQCRLNVDGTVLLGDALFRPSTAVAPRTYSLDVSIRDGDTAAPVTAASIALRPMPAGATVTRRANGVLHLSGLPPRTYALSVSREDYLSVGGLEVNPEADQAGVEVYLPRLPAQSAPTNLTVGWLTATTARLSWRDNSSYETGFPIEQSDDGGRTWSVVRVAPSGNTLNHAYVVTGLNPQQTHVYRVAAAFRGSRTHFSNSAVLPAVFSPWAGRRS